MKISKNMSIEGTKVYKDFIENIPGGVLDQTLNMTPGVNLLWGGMKNAINGSKNMRIIRGIEFFEIIADPEFIKHLEESEQALDGLSMCFEAYTKERNKKKRKFIKNIFLGFIDLPQEEKEKFELEKMLNITKRISDSNITYLKFIKHYIIDSNIDIFGNYLKMNLEDIENIFIKDFYTGSNLRHQQIEYNSMIKERIKLLNINNTLDELHNNVTFDDMPEEFMKFITDSKLETEIEHRNELSNLGLLRIGLTTEGVNHNKIIYSITPTLIQFISYILESEH